jgi:hypothetical protein
MKPDQAHTHRILAIGVVTMLMGFDFWRTAVAQELQLEINTSATQANPEAVLPPPPPVEGRVIDPNSDPATTVDMPLSLVGEQILESVCESFIDPQKALMVMPDLSEIHIQRACPKQLAPKS